MRVLLLLFFMFSLPGVMADEFQKVPADDLIIMELDSGRVMIQLIPAVAPNHVARFKQLVASGQYDGKSFYRVIEGFVAQGGLENDDTLNTEDATKLAPLGIESELAYQAEQFTVVQTPDLFAPETGFFSGFPAAADPETHKAWLTHCPGALAMARGNEADSATSDFYIVIGQAPRYLDRIMTVFGRVVSGFDAVQRIRRGKSSENGIISDVEQRTIIHKVSLVSMLPEAEQPLVEVLKTQGDTFSERIASRKHRSHAFFFKKPPAVLDVCQIPLPVKIDGELN